MRICLIGGSGKMGLEIFNIIKNSTDLTHSGNINQNTNETQANEYLDNSDIIIDFSLPHSTIKYLAMAADKNLPYVIGTTGFTAQDQHLIEQAAQKISIVKYKNMSLGVNLLVKLVEQAANILTQKYGFDISICEMHHKHKVDKPSGTALLLGEAAKKAKKNVNIEYSSMRGGTVIGDHEVIFAGDNERIILSHLAQDRKIFAIGAIKAALWLRDQQPGLYNMQHVLNLI